ncbi:hypothetical protein B9G55_01530 [Saccharibacillus sp. O16]|nr:hypothetical protein B9G55_01530 [Saccharibacillus sp. O16]
MSFEVNINAAENYSFARMMANSQVFFNIVGGNFHMENHDHSRSMKDINFSGATFGDNVNFQGDHNTQSVQGKVIDESLEKVLNSLITEIKGSIADPDDQQDCIDEVNKIKKAVSEGNKERAAKIYARLSEGVKVLASAGSLAKILGII